MKLALVYHQFVPRGGLEGYLLTLVHRLHAAGHELEIVTSKADAEMKALAHRVHLISATPFSALNLMTFAHKSDALVQKLKVDAVLGFGRTFRQDIHRAGGGCHATYSRILPWLKQMRIKNRLELALERKLYCGGSTSRFVVNSKKVAREINDEYGLDMKRIHVIHTAVDTRYFKPADDRRQVRKDMGISDDRAILLCVSLDHRRKGLSSALRAMASCSHNKAELWVAGESLSAWRRDILALGLGDRVKELGSITDLRPHYQAADVFVHPTHYDACANTVLQSMACGLPGIISSRDGACEFIRHDENGWRLHDPDDIDELADHMQSAIVHAEGMRTAARCTVQPLTWHAHLADWMHVIGMGKV